MCVRAERVRRAPVACATGRRESCGHDVAATGAPPARRPATEPARDDRALTLRFAPRATQAAAYTVGIQMLAARCARSRRYAAHWRITAVGSRGANATSPERVRTSSSLRSRRARSRSIRWPAGPRRTSASTWKKTACPGIRWWPKGILRSAVRPVRRRWRLAKTPAQDAGGIRTKTNVASTSKTENS